MDKLKEIEKAVEKYEVQIQELIKSEVCTKEQLNDRNNLLVLELLHLIHYEEES